MVGGSGRSLLKGDFGTERGGRGSRLNASGTPGCCRPASASLLRGYSHGFPREFWKLRGFRGQDIAREMIVVSEKI